jgi:hypothetical protein
VAEKEEAKKTGKAFVISQIGDEHSDVRARADEVLEYIIGPAAAEHGLEVVRSDRDPTPGQVTSRLIKSILESRVIIADLSGRNANVYYELGVVHSFRLPVVILVDHVASLSFDTEHERVIEIGDDGTITARQADVAKKKLRESLGVVLKSGYTPSSLVTEVAEAQSLAKLAPDDPVASELATIKQRLDEMVALQRASSSAAYPATGFRFAPTPPAEAFDLGGARYLPTNWQLQPTDPELAKRIAVWALPTSTFDPVAPPKPAAKAPKAEPAAAPRHNKRVKDEKV